jgi:antitoxin component of MazEF toxin-antitoxin module
MKVKVRQVGNSLTVTIPKEIAMDLGLGPDVEMDVSMRGRAVVMEPVGSRWDRLVAEVRRQAAERGPSEGDIDLAMAEARDREA